jgi:hypothetical protein
MRQVSIMFSIAKSGVRAFKTFLTKLWPTLRADKSTEKSGFVLQVEPKEIRNHPGEGATRRAFMSDPQGPVKRQPDEGRMRSVSSSSVSSRSSETRMADVIRLQDRFSRGRKMHQTGTGEDATILMFTGIRYERIENADVPKAPGIKPAIKPLNGASKKH